MKASLMATITEITDNVAHELRSKEYKAHRIYWVYGITTRNHGQVSFRIKDRKGTCFVFDLGKDGWSGAVYRDGRKFNEDVDSFWSKIPSTEANSKEIVKVILSEVEEHLSRINSHHQV